MLPTLLAHGLPPRLAADPSTGSTYRFTQKVYLHQTNAHTLEFLKRPSILQIAVSLTADGGTGAAGVLLDECSDLLFKWDYQLVLNTAM